MVGVGLLVGRGWVYCWPSDIELPTDMTGYITLPLSVPQQDFRSLSTEIISRNLLVCFSVCYCNH
jgi:hypothetical protein